MMTGQTNPQDPAVDSSQDLRVDSVQTATADLSQGATENTPLNSGKRKSEMQDVPLVMEEGGASQEQQSSWIGTVCSYFTCCSSKSEYESIDNSKGYTLN